MLTKVYAADWFQTKCGALKSSMLQFKSLKSGLNISISVTGIDFDSSVWFAQDITLNFLNCCLKQLDLVVGSNRSADTHLHISGSQIGSHIGASDSTICLENCTVLSTNLPNDKTLINVVNSTVNLKSLYVEEFQGGRFLQVTTGKAHIKDTEFVHCTFIPLFG